MAWDIAPQVALPVRFGGTANVVCLGGDAKTQKQQLQAYVAWVNSQIKKKAGSSMIHDLSYDMRDGVALAHLVEVVAGESLDICAAPSNSEQMRHNVEQVLQFMARRRIRMHHTTANDIMNGDLKSIMRLILALAARYKPSSVKQSDAYRESPRGNKSVTEIAHGAAAALAEARRDASFISCRPRRPKQLMEEQRESRIRGSGSDSERGQFRSLRSREREELEGASSGSSPRSSVASSPHASRRLDYALPKSQSHDFPTAPSGTSRSESEAEEWEVHSALWQELVEEHERLKQEMEDTKKTLLRLQELLLSGQPPDGAEAEPSMPAEGGSADEHIVILKNRLLQSELQCKDLKEELSRVKNDCMELQGMKSGLQRRLTDQEETVIRMKAELLRMGFAQQSAETEKNDLDLQIEEKDKTVLELRHQLALRDRQIEDIMTNLHLQHQEKESTTRNLRAQIQDLHEKLKRVGDTEASLAARVASQDRKMQRLEGKILQSQHEERGSRPSSSRSAHSTGSDDVQVVRDSLHSLRTSLPGSDPHHQTIDALEQSIASLMERLSVSEQASRRSDSSIGSRSRVNYDSTGDFRRSPITAIQGFPGQRLESPPSSTKVLYFMDEAVTPFMCTIPKRLGEIRLQDFKDMFDRHGKFRYHFKAMDPEFGTVKEEMTHPEDVIPGWEGKIVAWIEEDHG